MNEKSIPSSKFEAGDLALMGRQAVKILKKDWSERKWTWRYAVRNIEINKVKNTVSFFSGTGGWQDEKYFREITDSHSLLLLKKFQIETKIQGVKAELVPLESRLEKIRNALDVIKEECETVPILTEPKGGEKVGEDD